jgi:hypothetical protein
MVSTQWQIQDEHPVPYYEDTQKRTFRQKIVKIRSTIYMLLAYACPNNKLRIFFHKRRGVHIGKNVYLGMFCFLDNLQPSYIYIEDNGEGMTVDELSNIKEMFYSTKKNGTGLGVALSNEIVVAHNGELNYSSVKNEGTICTVSLPM